jgi:molybdopterin molybdotransferase
MQEDTRVEVDKPGLVWVLDGVKPWENVRFRGEDVKRGAVIPGVGVRLETPRLGLFAALGVASAPVSRIPRVAVLATGSELVEPGQPLAPGQIYESNRVLLSALLVQAGAEPRIFPLVPDNLASTQAALEVAFARCDAVVTSGGVSVGEFDFVKAAFEKSGGRLDLWKVAIRPGKPFVFGEREGKFLFGLPGNPVSGFVTFLLLVRPALLRWQGMDHVALPVHAGVLAEALSNRADRRHFVRVRRAQDGTVTSTGPQSSHLLRSLAEANGLVDVPPRTTLPAGASVNVLGWEG